MGTKTIKNVDEQTWREFKILATQENKEMGAMLKKMVQEYRREVEEFWDNLLGGDPVLTDKEAKAMMKDLKEMRKEVWFKG